MTIKGQKFNNPRLGMSIIVYDIEGKEYFSGRDLMVELGYSEASKPLRAFDDGGIVWDDQKIKVYVHDLEITTDPRKNFPGVTFSTPSVSEEEMMSPKVTNRKINNNITFTTETGLYQLIFASRLPAAQDFQRWVFETVLPSIRKNGGFIDGNNPTEVAQNAKKVLGDIKDDLLAKIEELQKENDKEFSLRGRVESDLVKLYRVAKDLVALTESNGLGQQSTVLSMKELLDMVNKRWEIE